VAEGVEHRPDLVVRKNAVAGHLGRWLMDADERRRLDEVAAEGPFVGSAHHGERSVGDDWLLVGEAFGPLSHVRPHHVGSPTVTESGEDLGLDEPAIVRQCRGSPKLPAPVWMREVRIAELPDRQVVTRDGCRARGRGCLAFLPGVPPKLDLGLELGRQVTCVRQRERRVGADVDAFLLLCSTALHPVEKGEDPPPARKDADSEPRQGVVEVLNATSCRDEQCVERS